MGTKRARRIELVVGLASVSCLLIFLSNRSPVPQTAQAGLISGAVRQIENHPVCQPVIDQIGEISREESTKVDLRGPETLAQVDECIAREQAIDLSRCPSDFRLAETNFLAAQRILCRDAHTDIFSEPNVVTRAYFDVYAHRSPYDSLDRMSDRMKRDVDVFQAATFDFLQVSARYGVN
jgi:hypothetical protein